MDTIVWFEDTCIDDVPQVGGKAASLGELIAAGIPVPYGFTVPAGIYFHFIETTGLDALIAGILRGLDVNDSQQLEHKAAQIRELIGLAPMPSFVADDIVTAYKQLTLATDGRVAVRSSATAEDLPDDSFAGQQSTYLNVVGPEAVVRAVQNCWASLFETRAIVYRTERGYDHMQVGLAAVVQQMVQSEQAGVMFTINSTTGDPSVIEISAGHGLGESVVSGAIVADSYLVGRDTGEITQTSGSQSQMLVRTDQPDGDEFNHWVQVPDNLLGQPVLTDQQIRDLADLGKHVQQHYGKPMDIEWAIGPDGVIVLTQARPITVNKTPQVEDESITEDEPAQLLLSGQPASPGVVTGRVRTLEGPHQNDLVQPGDILVANMTDPNYLPAMKRAAAVVTQQGSRLCHAAIVSRELGLPCIVGVANTLSTLSNGDVVTVDGSHGEIFAGEAATRLEWEQRRQQRIADLTAATANLQTRTKIYAILADPTQAAEVAAMGADGTGLLRLEFILQSIIGEHPESFLARRAGNDFINKLVTALDVFLRAFGPDRPVVLRLTDFKTNEYRNLSGSDKFENDEENPMLGLRGAARYLQRREAFALEVEAIRRLRSVHPNLIVMVPFVRTPEELAQVMDLLREGGVEGNIWMMAEVPSNVLFLEEFIAQGITGISIGSNDLTQLVFGIDRDNPALTAIADERHPILMMALRRLITTANRFGVTVGICGQAPSDFPEITQKLVELGITSISVTPDVIARTRQIVADAEKTLDVA